MTWARKQPKAQQNSKGRFNMAILLRSLVIALALLAAGFRTVAIADAGGNFEQCEQANAHSEALENCPY
jgi:hypothetical protein